VRIRHGTMPIGMFTPEIVQRTILTRVGIDIGLAGVGAFDVGAVLGMLGGAGVKVVVYVISLVFSLAMVDSDTLELRHED